jgi:hypothetical protein
MAESHHAMTLLNLDSALTGSALVPSAGGTARPHGQPPLRFDGSAARPIAPAVQMEKINRQTQFATG